MTEVHRSPNAEPQLQLPFWVAPAAIALVAVPTFVAFWIGGRPGLGAIWAAVNLALALVLALGRRSDTIRLASGTVDDERTRLLDYKATSAMGVVLVVALVVLFLAAGVRGESGLVYGVLLLLGEAARLTALAVLNRRS
jgi:hypothetical protein